MTGSWSLQPILNSYPLVGLIGLALALTLLCPLFRRLTTARQATLLALRGLVICLLVVAMLRPTLISTSAQRQSAVLLVLFDQSRSMQLPDAAGSQSRWEAQRDALRSAEPVLPELQEQMEIRVYGYDQQLEPRPLVDGAFPLPREPEGEQTDIGTSLQDAIRQETGKRLAGVILLGDGTQTAWEPRVEVSQAGRELSRLGYPLYSVAFGPAGDQTQARDVAIENLPEKYTVFVKNELPVRGLMRVSGYVNEIPVDLVVEGPDGSREVLGPVLLQPRTDGQQLPVEMTYVPQQPGQYKLTMRAAVQAGELVTKNNELSAFLTVLEGGLNVLYLEGEYRNEVRFLLRALEASPDIQVSFDILERKGRADWPVDLGEVLEDERYDVFVLGDLDADALGPDNLRRLAEAVERGKGLAMLGGLHSFGPGGYHGTPLEDVLPITMSRFERQDFDGPFRPDLHHEGPLKLLPARSHPVMQLAPADENRLVWEQLPPLRGANRFQGLKENPSVQVLGESPQGVPLVVASEYVRGRVLAIAGDSTWQWAMKGFDQEHKRFWRQVILWLARRDAAEENDVWVKLEQRRYRLGSRVVFTAGARSSSGDVLDGVQLEAEWVRPDGSRQVVALSSEESDFLGSLEAVRQSGDHLLEVRARAGGKLVGTARANFQVLDEDVELSNPAADPDQLARLARMTEQFGGRVVLPEQLPDLLRTIAARPPEFEVQVQRKWQLGSTPLDAWLFLLVLTGLLGGEWALRKRWGLV